MAAAGIAEPENVAASVLFVNNLLTRSFGYGTRTVKTGVQ